MKIFLLCCLLIFFVLTLWRTERVKQKTFSIATITVSIANRIYPNTIKSKSWNKSMSSVLPAKFFDESSSKWHTESRRFIYKVENSSQLHVSRSWHSNLRYRRPHRCRIHGMTCNWVRYNSISGQNGNIGRRARRLGNRNAWQMAWSTRWTHTFLSTHSDCDRNDWNRHYIWIGWCLAISLRSLWEYPDFHTPDTTVRRDLSFSQRIMSLALWIT